MLLCPGGPDSNNARLPVQPQKYCAPKSPTVFHAVVGLYWLDRNWTVQARLHAKMAVRSRASGAV